MVSAKEVESTTHSGLSKSGRWWKPMQDNRFSNIRKDKQLHSSWDKKLKYRAEKESVRSYANRLKEQKKQEKIEYWERVKAHRVVKETNRKKSEVVQVITNTKKLKRMKKKQLRQIQKRDTGGVATKKMLPGSK